MTPTPNDQLDLPPLGSLALMQHVAAHPDRVHVWVDGFLVGWWAAHRRTLTGAPLPADLMQAARAALAHPAAELAAMARLHHTATTHHRPGCRYRATCPGCAPAQTSDQIRHQARISWGWPHLPPLHPDGRPNWHAHTCTDRCRDHPIPTTTEPVTRTKEAA